jgi:hypothetical protein
LASLHFQAATKIKIIFSKILKCYFIVQSLLVVIVFTNILLECQFEPVEGAAALVGQQNHK